MGLTAPVEPSYLAGEYLGDAAAGAEVAAIRDGTIRATGYRLVGVLR